MINYANNDVIVAPDGKWLDFGIDPTIYRVYTTSINGSVTASPSSGYTGTEVTLSNTPASGYELYSYDITGATLKNDNQFDIGNSDVYVRGIFGRQLPESNRFEYRHFAGDTPHGIDGYDITIRNFKLNGEVPPMYTIFVPSGAWIPGSTNYERLVNGEWVSIYNGGEVMPDTQHIEPQIEYSSPIKLRTLYIEAYTNYNNLGKPGSLRGKLRAFDPYGTGERYVTILDFSLPYIATGNATVKYSFDFTTGQATIITP